MWGLVLASVAALVAAALVWTSSQALLQPPRPRSLSPFERPCTTAGPVLASSLSHLTLDGLTIIPMCAACLSRTGTLAPGSLS